MNVDAAVTVSAAERNGWLRLDDAALLKVCRGERYRSSGPGGQRRSKVETAVRLHHAPSGLSARAQDSRSPQANRLRAVRRLRERIALEVRTPFDLAAPELPEELVAQRGPKGSLRVNQRNQHYPLMLATTLDALVAAGGSYAKAARPLGLTTSQLMRFLRADRQAWRQVERIREQG